MAFKMKGFSPFTKEDKTWKKRWEEKYNTSYPDVNITSIDFEPGFDDSFDPSKMSKISDRFPKRKRTGTWKGQDHHVRPGKISKKGTLSPSEQQKIQKSITKEGHFGDIDPSLVKGYGSRDSHSYRKRVAEINAHHQYLSHSDPYDKGRGERKLQKKLGQLQNWDTRYTDFTG